VAPTRNSIDPSSRDKEAASVDAPAIDEADVVGSGHDRHMDSISTVQQALAIKWDVPYRLVASVLAICVIAAAIAGIHPTDVLQHAASWAGWPQGSEAFRATQHWLAPKHALLVWVGTILVIAGLAFAHRDGRGPATAWIGSALLAETSLSWLALTLFVVFVVLSIVAPIVGSRVFDILNDPTRHARAGILTVPLAGGYLALAPLAWAVQRR
jgi:hypothetical protein